MLITEATLPTHSDLIARRDALGLSHVTDDEVNMVAYAMYEQTDGGSLLYSFEQSLSMDLHIPVARFKAATTSTDVRKVADRILTIIEEHHTTNRVLRALDERIAGREHKALRKVWHRLGRQMLARA
jgi:hypothetical protein